MGQFEQIVVAAARAVSPFAGKAATTSTRDCGRATKTRHA